MFIIVLGNLIIYLLSQNNESFVHDENVQQEKENTSAYKVSNSSFSELILPMSRIMRRLP